MSDQLDPSAISGTPASTLTVLLWRQALAKCALVPRVEDLEMWIGQLESTGVTALLERCVAVLRGGGAALTADTELERWTGVVALDELRTLASRVGGAMTLVEEVPRWSGAPDNTAGIAPDWHPALPANVGALAESVLSSLESNDDAADRQLIESLATLRDLRWRLQGFDYRRCSLLPLPELIAAIATVTLVDFALRTSDLWAGPYGSATLMRAAARFDATGLGAYRSQVGLIARSSADVYDLARFAVAASPSSPRDAREAWICFLCRNCRRDLLIEIIDDLGDVAASRPLSMILGMLVNRIDIDVELLRRVRDAALDNGDWPLAARAQQLVANARDHDGGELAILGSLYVMSGHVAAAAAIFRELKAGQWPGADERLQALKAGAFARYMIERGYTSPADRQATRLHRRGEAPRYVRVRGHRIDAVDVN